MRLYQNICYYFITRHFLKKVSLQIWYHYIGTYAICIIKHVEIKVTVKNNYFLFTIEVFFSPFIK